MLFANHLVSNLTMSRFLYKGCQPSIFCRGFDPHPFVSTELRYYETLKTHGQKMPEGPTITLVFVSEFFPLHLTKIRKQAESTCWYRSNGLNESLAPKENECDATHVKQCTRCKKQSVGLWGRVEACILSSNLVLATFLRVHQKQCTESLLLLLNV